MIIKSLSHKSTRKYVMNKLIHYVFEPSKTKDKIGNRKPLVVKQYIQGYDYTKWADYFKENDDKRTFEHKKRTVLRHEIISFSPKSNKQLTREKLKIFAKYYLKHRCPESMGVCGVHYEEAIHLHFIISAVSINGKSTRISRQVFKDFKIQIQEFQQEKFPELSDSIVNHRKKKL